jgi:hypothetical protein
MAYLDNVVPAVLSYADSTSTSASAASLHATKHMLRES